MNFKPENRDIEIYTLDERQKLLVHSNLTMTLHYLRDVTPKEDCYEDGRCPRPLNTGLHTLAYEFFKIKNLQTFDLPVFRDSSKRGDNQI